MNLFTLAAPIFDLAMKISGHDKVLVELAERIKLDLEFEQKNEQNYEKKNYYKRSQSNCKLLDLGGGTGELARYLPENMIITIADPSNAMLKKGRKKEFRPQVKHVLADGANLPFEDNSFDCVTISDALHHFDKVDKALAEANRVLKPGGKIYILEFDPRTFFTKTIIFFEKIAGEPVNFYQPKELSKMLSKREMKIELEYLNKSLYIMQAQKAIN